MSTSLELAGRVANVLGLTRATVVQHLRNLQSDDRISFKGYGRGAARMGPRDAASLLLAAVGSDLVKNSLATLDSFGSLRPIRIDRPASGVTFLDHLTSLLTAAAAGGGTSCMARESDVAFRLVSAVVGEAQAPRSFAVAGSVAGAKDVIGFAPPGWNVPLSSEAEIATSLRGSGSGLVRVGIVTVEALEEVAESL